jgi:hypothetical protein
VKGHGFGRAAKSSNRSGFWPLRLADS